MALAVHNRHRVPVEERVARDRVGVAPGVADAHRDRRELRHLGPHHRPHGARLSLLQRAGETVECALETADRGCRRAPLLVGEQDHQGPRGRRQFTVQRAVAQKRTQGMKLEQIGIST